MAGRADAMQAASPYSSLGADIGGTFTDLILCDEEREELTPPQDPTEGVIAGPVSISSDVALLIRGYERTSTTVANGWLVGHSENVN
jgi:N-methylhydantoinase A/oxoprolinase/acetone carboxylase beta subunit